VSRFLPRHSPDLPALRNANILRWFKSSSLWTERETRTLNDLVEQYSNDWFLISSKLYGRTSFACWQPNKIKKELVLHSWPQEAIRILDYLILKYGRWQIIPILLPGTTPFNYYMRSATNIWGWRNQIIFKIFDTENLDVQKRWSADELRKLLELRSQYETDWCKISKGLPGRSPSACFYKYQVITRLLMKTGNDITKCIKQKLRRNTTIAQPWSEEDILKLKNLTEIHGKDWNKIASQLPGKTSEDYYDRIARFIPGKSQESIRSYVTTHKQELLPKELDMTKMNNLKKDYLDITPVPVWNLDEFGDWCKRKSMVKAKIIDHMKKGLEQRR
ncbi:18934_t:CDS:2, partial [Racocetra persica]